MVHTHELTVSESGLVKRYSSWDRGEHRREWLVLRSLHERAPGLGPAPVAADLDATPPWVSMSRLPGTPLRGRLTDSELDALEVALRALWAVPTDGLPPRRFHLAEAWRVTGEAFGATPRPAGIVGEAFDSAVELLSGPPPAGATEPVLGHGDPNLANYLSAAGRVRVVDFEDAGVSDTAVELGTLVEHLSARHTDWTAFLARFDVDGTRLVTTRRVMAAFWLHLLLRADPSPHRNPLDAVDRQAARLLSLVA